MTRKTAFFEGWSWFKFNNLGLALGTNLKFYTSLSKGLKLKVRKFLGLINTFVEVTGEKLPPPILNRVKHLSQSGHLRFSLGFSHSSSTNTSLGKYTKFPVPSLSTPSRITFSEGLFFSMKTWFSLKTETRK